VLTPLLAAVCLAALAPASPGSAGDGVAALAGGPGAEALALRAPGRPADAAAGRPLRLPAPRALHQEDDAGARYDDEEEHRPHLLVSGWGGEGLANGGSGRSSSFFGGEVAWVFSQVDVGLAGSWYRSLRDATRAWTPVVLTRVTQRFVTGRGFDAAFSIGFGAGRPAGWIGWYQVALGLRVPLGPLFLGGELAFEQYDIIRLGAGLGVGF
jgi:hypothetical protein